MRILRVIIITWLLTGCGVALGWIVTQTFGRQTSFLVSVVLGTLAILLAIKRLARRGWLNPDRRRGGSIGGLCGFAIAAPLAKMAMYNDQPLVALLCIGLVGVGVVAGAGSGATQ